MAREMNRLDSRRQHAVAIEQHFRLDHRIVVVDDPLAAETFPEPRMVRDVIAVRQEHAADAAQVFDAADQGGREAR